MVTHFITCGDSFGCGVGLESGTCFEKSFAGVASQYFNIPQFSAILKTRPVDAKA